MSSFKAALPLRPLCSTPSASRSYVSNLTLLSGRTPTRLRFNRVFWLADLAGICFAHVITQLSISYGRWWQTPISNWMRWSPCVLSHCTSAALSTPLIPMWHRAALAQRLRHLPGAPFGPARRDFANCLASIVNGKVLPTVLLGDLNFPEKAGDWQNHAKWSNGKWRNR